MEPRPARKRPLFPAANTFPAMATPIGIPLRLPVVERSVLRALRPSICLGLSRLAVGIEALMTAPCRYCRANAETAGDPFRAGRHRATSPSTRYDGVVFSDDMEVRVDQRSLSAGRACRRCSPCAPASTCCVLPRTDERSRLLNAFATKRKKYGAARASRGQQPAGIGRLSGTI